MFNVSDNISKNTFAIGIFLLATAFFMVTFSSLNIFLDFSKFSYFMATIFKSVFGSVITTNSLTDSTSIKSLIVLSVFSLIILAIGVIGGILIYRNTLKPLIHKVRSRKISNKEKNIAIVSQNIITSVSADSNEKSSDNNIEIQKDSTKKNILTTEDLSEDLSNPKKFIVRITILLSKCESAIESKNCEEAKKYYDAAKEVYFKSNVDYEHKSKVYRKLIILKKVVSECNTVSSTNASNTTIENNSTTLS